MQQSSANLACNRGDQAKDYLCENSVRSPSCTAGSPGSIAATADCEEPCTGERLVDYGPCKLWLHWIQSRHWKHGQIRPEKAFLSLSSSSFVGDCPTFYCTSKSDGLFLPQSGKEPILWLHQMHPQTCKRAMSNRVVSALYESTDVTSSPASLVSCRSPNKLRSFLRRSDNAAATWA